MNDLNKALGDISSIRRQVAHTTEFRGYGPATLAATGAFAVLAALIQAWWLPEPGMHVGAYVGIWTVTALLSGVLVAVQTHTRARRMHSRLSDEMVRMAVAQFIPSLASGALLTLVLLRAVPGNAWMLPGLWQIIFSLGVFASCRSLPRKMVLAGGWYLLTGIACISLGDVRALSPWSMGAAYGAGQLLVAGILLMSAREDADEA